MGIFDTLKKFSPTNLIASALGKITGNKNVEVAYKATESARAAAGQPTISNAIAAVPIAFASKGIMDAIVKGKQPTLTNTKAKVPAAKVQNASVAPKAPTQTQTITSKSKATTVKGLGMPNKSGGGTLGDTSIETLKKKVITGVLGDGAIADKLSGFTQTLPSTTSSMISSAVSTTLGNATPKKRSSKRKKSKKSKVKKRRSKRRSKSRKKKRYGTAKQYARKGGKTVHYTKNGQPYILLASGKARFVKGRRRKK